METMRSTGDGTIPISSTDKTDTNGRLISSRKVEGTGVFSTNGDKIGAIDSLMIDKQTGQVAYAVMSFGGFLGVGQKYHALPWAKLTYVPRLEGYAIDVDTQMLKDAPSHGADDEPFSDPDYARRLSDYYKVEFYSLPL